MTRRPLLSSPSRDLNLRYREGAGQYSTIRNDPHLPRRDERVGEVRLRRDASTVSPSSQQHLASSSRASQPCRSPCCIPRAAAVHEPPFGTTQ
ncbi:unnamed protein product [Ixodes pacificus]